MPQHHAHSHGTNEVSDRVLLWAVLINAGLSVFEFAAGLISGSVALMADALPFSIFRLRVLATFQ